MPFESKFDENIPIVKISRLLMYANENFLFVSNVEEKLNISEARALHVLEQLEKTGYVQKMDEINAWCNTISGILLAEATFYRTFTRKECSEKIASCLERIRSINANSYHLFKVTEAYIFGEYIESGADTIRYIDVLVRLVAKEKVAEKHTSLKRQRIDMARKRFSNHLEQLLYPEQEVKGAIKDRTHNLRIHSFRDSELYDNVRAELLSQKID